MTLRCLYYTCLLYSNRARQELYIYVSLGLPAAQFVDFFRLSYMNDNTVRVRGALSNGFESLSVAYINVK